MPYQRADAPPATASPATAQPAWTATTADPAGQQLSLAGATALPDAQSAAATAADSETTAVAQGRTQGDAVSALDTAPPGAPHRTRPGRPRPRRTGWRIGGLHVLQVVVWQAVVAVVLAVHRQPLAVLVPVLALAAVALLLTAVRLRGRWLWSWAALALRYRTRRRRVVLGHPGVTPVADVVDALLGQLAPEARVTGVELEDQDTGVVVHRDGIAVVLAVSPTTDDPTTEPARTLPPLTALLPPDDGGDVPLTVQLLVQTVPAPGWSGDADPAAVSYRQLTGGTVPARRRSWVVLQVRRRPEDEGTEDLVVVLGNAVRRVRRQLGRASLRTHLLGPDDLRAALLGVAALDAAPDGTAVPAGGGTGRGSVRESWRSWRAGDAVHTSFRLLDWPSLEAVEGQDLVDRLGTVTGLPTTVAVAARRTGDQVELSTSLRVRLPTGQDVAAGVTGVGDELTRAAEAAGARIERLDGRHRHGMAAALPLGGFLR